MRKRSILVALVGAALILFGAAGSAAFADAPLPKQSETTVFFPPEEGIAPVQVTLSWPCASADLDLHVIHMAPNGGHAYYGDPAGIPGGQYGVDFVNGPGLETWNGPTAEEGAYWIAVSAYDDVPPDCEATLTVQTAAGGIVFSGMYTFTASDVDDSGVGNDSASFWDAFHFTSVPAASTTIGVMCTGSVVSNTGPTTCRCATCPSPWSISATFPIGTTCSTVSSLVNAQLNDPNPVTNGGFLAAGCTSSFGNGALMISCPGSGTVEIDFDGGGFQPLVGATVNGLSFFAATDEAIPTLSQAGMVAFLSLLMLVGVSYIHRRRMAIER